jgi:hypothetical protein
MKWFLVLFCLNYNTVSAQISTVHRDTLTKHLNILSQAWSSPSVDICNQILSTPNYTWQDWRIFFNNYYAQFPLTDDLLNYMSYPTIFWLSPETHFKLQQGQKWALFFNIDSIFSISNLGSQLSANALLRQELFNYLKFLDNITYNQYTALPDSSLDNIDMQIVSWINTRQFLKRNQNINPALQPYAAVAALRVHAIFLQLKPLTSSRIDSINTLLTLPVLHQEIFKNHKVFIADNNMMKQADLFYIDTLLDIVPHQIHSLRILTENDYLYAQGQSTISQSYNLPGVNVFSTIGGYKENGFPPDIAPYDVDGFALVVDHELNHRVDPDYIYLDSSYYRRRRQLLTQAGTTALNYLRSMFSGDFFQTYPQEFFASLSNQYLANTFHTLELGIQRFNQGYKEPINQFLYFAEIYSLRGTSTKFFLNNTQALIQSFSVPVTRDTRDFIKGFTFKGIIYTFSLDTSGNVLGITITPTITAESITTFCQGSSVVLTSSSTLGNQWYKDGVAISGATGNTYTVTTGGNYTVKIPISGNSSVGYEVSNSILAVVNPIPSTPVISTGGATTFCTGGSTTLSSNASNDNQWYKDGIAINGSTGTSFNANASGNYTTKVTINGCQSVVSNAIVIIVNPLPAQPAAITGNNNVVLAQTLDYSIDPLANATGYNWQLSGGGVIQSGQNTITAKIYWTTAGNYILSINGVNNCGNGLAKTLNITVTNGVTGIVNPDNQFQIKVVPNPSPGEFYLTAKGLVSKKIRIDVINNLGQTIYQTEQRVPLNDFNKMIDLSKMADGIYNVRIYTDNKFYLRRIAKLKQ